MNKEIAFINDFRWKIGDITVTKDVVGTDAPTRDFLIQIVDVSGTHVDTAAILKDGETSGVIRVDQVTKLALTETKLKEFNLNSMTFVKTKKIDGTVISKGSLVLNSETGKYEILIYPGEEVSITVVNEFKKIPFFHDDFGKMNDFGASDSAPISTASEVTGTSDHYLIPERKKIIFVDEALTYA